MSSGQTGARGALTIIICLFAVTAFASDVPLKESVAAPLKAALQSLDFMCREGSQEACDGASVLRARQAHLMTTNAQCASGRASACTGLLADGYELEALANAVARQAEAFERAD